MSGSAAQAAATRHTRRVGGAGCVQAAMANPTAACETGVGTECSEARAPCGDDAEHQLLTESALVLGDDGDDRGIGRGGALRVHDFEHEAGFARRAAAGVPPRTFGCPERKPRGQSRAYDVLHKNCPDGIADAQRVPDVTTKVEPLGDDLL